MESRYSSTAIVLHWLIALLLAGQFAFGWYLGEIPRGVPARGYFVNLHKSTGLLIGLLILVRIGWRLTHKPPPLYNTVPRWQQQAATATHYLLYVLMMVMPLSGYLASNVSKHGVNFFNSLKLLEDPLVILFCNASALITYDEPCAVLKNINLN